jgi:hypothetical protein
MKCFYHNDLDGNAAAYCVHVWQERDVSGEET